MDVPKIEKIPSMGRSPADDYPNRLRNGDIDREIHKERMFKGDRKKVLFKDRREPLTGEMVQAIDDMFKELRQAIDKASYALKGEGGSNP